MDEDKKEINLEQASKVEQGIEPAIKQEVLEQKEIPPTEQEQKEQLKKTIEEMGEPPLELREEAKIEAEELKKTGQAADAETLISHFLKKADEKGLLYAIALAKETGDPQILDLFHDYLVKDELYKRFIK